MFACFETTNNLGDLKKKNYYFILFSILLGASSLSVVTIYPLMKRLTHWPQAVLGVLRYFEFF